MKGRGFMDGILNVYKEPGFTSHDVVAKLRGICKQKKIGHTGTLDPDASGVLPVCLGNATKVCGLLTDKQKEYRTVLLLGRTTDTQDVTGKTLEEKPVILREEEVRKAALSFVGEYDQVPPMYSALKVNGKKLCDLARAGREVERASRKVTILSLEIEKIDLPRVWMKVACSKGTYIRTLCHDIGQKLGCGGTMESLVRTRSGAFSIETARKLSEIQALADAGKLEEALIPVDTLFEDLPRATVRTEWVRLAENGNPLRAESLVLEEPLLDRPTGKQEDGQGGTRIRIYGPQGRFYGIYALQNGGGLFSPVKLFLGKDS